MISLYLKLSGFLRKMGVPKIRMAYTFLLLSVFNFIQANITVLSSETYSQIASGLFLFLNSFCFFLLFIDTMMDAQGVCNEHFD